ncbi:MAG: hypothetical protein QOE76_976 [Frankiales bacterium]|nr:hypothetical protein [Frankiales bacterium]
MSTSDSVTDTKNLAAGHAQQAAQGAQQRASEVASQAGDATHAVAGTASDQAQNVKEETVRQARNVLSVASSQVSAQAATQQTQRFSGILRELAEELGQTAGAVSGGNATELVPPGR